MIDDLALSALATCTRTWINAFAAQTSSITTAFSIRRAFGATAFVRIALVFGDATAFAIQTIGIRSAWRWIA